MDSDKDKIMKELEQNADNPFYAKQLITNLKIQKKMEQNQSQLPNEPEQVAGTQETPITPQVPVEAMATPSANKPADTGHKKGRKQKTSGKDWDSDDMVKDILRQNARNVAKNIALAKLGYTAAEIAEKTNQPKGSVARDIWKGKKQGDL